MDTPSAQMKRWVAEGVYAVVYAPITKVSGEKAFVYLAVKMKDLKRFAKAFAKGKFRPGDYGVILESGFGEPDSLMRERVKELYGFDHDSPMSLDLTS